MLRRVGNPLLADFTVKTFFTRPEPTLNGFLFIRKENPVLTFHAFTGSACQRAINLQLFITPKYNASFLDKEKQFFVTDARVFDHVAHSGGIVKNNP